MTEIMQLELLLRSMEPELKSGEWVFCSVDGCVADYAHLRPLAFFTESEGLSLIISVETAQKAKIPYKVIFKQITLTVHSSLEAVGLTAAVATKLTSYGISANIVAGYYHDHIFVQTEKAAQALLALQELG